ncbi:ATP-binding protein [Isoptericola sp. S6320L]|uniref:ATP-binding protein n=1 Tax=Isoptericola sp. S6320L TaxID=2926411 RepID=UPI001FF247AE|nr:ATP-binding protein [Isoptericola sp. S6320L]MCK0116973.1 ATP-binding protein [Isoptericola sp. S6320L]
MPEQPVETLDLTPSPRILEMIAETDLQIHQCLAELIDNCFDELQKAREAIPGFEGRVDITLPTAGRANRNSEVVVADSGRGMSPEQMEQALKAGSSSNSQYGTLGLFGMGFNVATARLGGVTVVRSGREGDDFWNVVTIDLTEMRRSGTFNAPLTKEPKPPGEHGTMIIIKSLRQDTVAKLQRQAELGRVRTQLGNIYTFMLRDPQRSSYSGSDVIGGLALSLYLNGNAIKPTVPCIWAPSRAVPYRGQDVKAVRSLDFPLTSAFACMDCGHWMSLSVDECTECSSHNVHERERRITGWLGIQRYNHNSDFGISLIRQGRVIVHRDKSLFEWIDDGDTRQVEYPIEVGGGRIVGEVHLDHAPVTFRKTNFDRENAAWSTMVQKVRGEAPLRPNKARELNLAENDSPLGILFNAYRRNDPGFRYLVPGNGRSAIHDQAREWARLFAAGDPEYQTDSVWYAAIEEHEAIVHGRGSDRPEPTADDSWLTNEGLGHLADGDDESDESGQVTRVDAEPDTPQRPATLDERFARYRENSVSVAGIEGKVSIGGATPFIRCYLTSGVDLSAESHGPHFAIRVTGGEVEMYVAGEHPLVAEYGWDATSVALVCAAPALSEVLQYSGTVDAFILSVLAAHDNMKLDHAAVRSRAEGLVERLRDLLGPVVGETPLVSWESLRPSSRREAELAAYRSSSSIDWMNAIETGRFADYVTVAGIKDLIAEDPERYLDGRVFRTTYSAFDDEGTRADTLDRLDGLLGDLGRMLGVTRGTSAHELSKYLLSAELIAAEVAD